MATRRISYDLNEPEAQDVEWLMVHFERAQPTRLAIAYQIRRADGTVEKRDEEAIPIETVPAAVRSAVTTILSHMLAVAKTEEGF